MDESEFKRRTRDIGLRVIRLAESLPPNRTADILARQLIRSATSIGANYRSACRSKSAADLIAKLAIAEEEADETIYWLEIVRDLDVIPAKRPLLAEIDEVLAMTVASIKTLRDRSANPKSKNQNPKSPCAA